MTQEKDWKKVLFSDETHFVLQRHKSKFVRRCADESITEGHMIQAVKHPFEMFCICFSYMETGTLIPIEGIMNSDKYKEQVLTC